MRPSKQPACVPGRPSYSPPASFSSRCQLYRAVLTLEPLASIATSGDLPRPGKPAAPRNGVCHSGQPCCSHASSVATARFPHGAATAPTLASTQAQAIPPSATRQADQPPAATVNTCPDQRHPATWKDVPIMPGATEGKEEDGAYSYIVNARLTRRTGILRQHHAAVRLAAVRYPVKARRATCC